MATWLYPTYRRMRYGKALIVVSGLPRSGTSMVMKMLEAGGVPLVTDGLRTADQDNPKGYYEFEPVKHLAEEPDKSWLSDARGRAIKVISHLLKELPPTLNYKVIFVRRELREVLASQSKMLARRGETSATGNERMLELFEQNIRKVGSMMRHAPHFDVLELQYSEVLQQPLEAARRLRRFLGGALDTRAMATVVDPQLYRNRA